MISTWWPWRQLHWKELLSKWALLFSLKWKDQDKHLCYLRYGPNHSLKLLFKKNFYCYSITVVCLFSPSLHPTLAKAPSLPHLYPPPWYCPCVLYSSSCNPLSSLAPPHSPLPIVRLFFTSMSLVIVCLLFSSIDYVPVKGEIIWYFSLTAWLISLHNALQFHPCCCKGYKLLLSLCWEEIHSVHIP